MPLTVRQIVQEAKHLSNNQLDDLILRLNSMLAQRPVDPKIEAAWIKEAQRRIADLDSGKVEAIPAEVVMRKMRRLVGQPRRRL